MTPLALEQLIAMNANETRLRYAIFHGAILGASLLGIGLLLPILGIRTIDWPLLVGGPPAVGAIHACLIYTGIAPRGP
ncbi:hypothetical protein [Halopiger xanaduensis]|uniref:Uncharacterized protein n=1 Tax=Halopiger xanaduensis (strain DSM 18323 / JCM 14033 / SH-6) TaxID=797210 RepID=F8DBC9_HALXS|nr:hypothetical protein [Halopiger xanaduensis]AEH35908.1 hypothetical protein Halxa_1275 [Halopiger xanaduensis SH-6]